MNSSCWPSAIDNGIRPVTNDAAATRVSEFHIPVDHPAFAGHFPGMPVLPGAVLLDLALLHIAEKRRLDLRGWRLESAKFLAAVQPGETLLVEYASPTDGSLRFVIRSGSLAVASATLAAGATTETLGHGTTRGHGT